ncbi:MAG: hypothetical protein ACE5GS_00110 [Kiloniellaceae bacterium]
MTKPTTFAWRNRFQRLLHEVLVRNELRQPADAYRLSWAGTARSGYSYGYAQFDLAAGGARPRRAFFRVLAGFAEQAPRLAPLLPQLEPALARRRGEMTAEEIDLIESHKRLINRALQSPEGRAVIDRMHVTHVEKLEGQVNALRDRANADARGFVRSVEGRLYIADYCNQFGAPTTFARYIQGQTVRIGGRPKTLTGRLTVPVWHDYVTSTKYAREHPADIRRRLRNVAKVVEADAAARAIA